MLIGCNSDQKHVHVPYLEKSPNIDGRLDHELSDLPCRQFNHIWQFDNPVTDTAEITYRLGYTVDHLYLYIESNVDSISYHRRGYLWGDGYKLLIGIPNDSGSTDEYYELAFSPLEEVED